MSDRAISEHFLERYALGELPPEAAEEVERAAAADPGVQVSLDVLRASNRDILARYPAADFVAALLESRKRAKAPVPTWKRWTVLASAGAALVLAVILLVPRIRQLSDLQTGGAGGEMNLVKGEAALDLTKTQLLVYKKSDDLAELVSDGDEVRAGALLQIAYVAAGEFHGAILSIDGRGGVSRHYPADEGDSTLLAPNRRIFLPNALELDDAPGFERFFLVTSSRPIDVGAVLAKAVELGKDPDAARRSDLDLPAGLKQTSVLVLKGEGSR